jgi:nitrogen PTS system EIIA component
MYNRGAAMEIKDVLALSGVLIIRHPSDKPHLLEELAYRAGTALDLPDEMILSALLKRESLGSTGTGNGIALPHARLPGVSKPFALLARLNKAINFDAIDGEPVDIVCVLLLPTEPEVGLHALACAARVLRDAEVVLHLRQATNHIEAYRALDNRLTKVSHSFESRHLMVSAKPRHDRAARRQ